MKKGLFLLAGVLASATAFSQFTPGRLVVVVVGDGIAVLSSSASPAALQEYTAAGVVGISVALPTAVSGANKRLTIAGSSTSEGFLARSSDGKYVTLIGYDADVATLTVPQTDSTTVNRVCGRIDAAGVVDTTTGIAAHGGSAGSNGNPRAAVTLTGGGFWTSGTSSLTPTASGGCWHVDLGGANLVQTLAAPNNSRVAKVFNGQLYVSSGSGANVGVNTVGVGAPTGTGEVATRIIDTSTTGVPNASPYDFYFSDANTCYVADDRTVVNGGGVQKFAYDTGTSLWVYQYTLSTGLPGTPSGVRGLCGVTVSGTTTLYATTAHASNANSIVSVTDTGASSAFSVIATAAANTAFRGIAFVPENPSSVTTIHPSTVTRLRGGELTGSSADVGASDDARWELRPGVVFSNTQDPIDIEYVGTAPSAGSALTATIEDQTSSASVRRKAFAWDYTANAGAGAYVLINTPTDPAWGALNTDEVKTYALTPALHIKAGTFEMKMHIAYRAVSAVFAYPYKVRIDEMKWTHTN